MSKMTLKSELLNQNDHSAVDQEVSRLHEIIAAEERRVRRLVSWTISVWMLWFLMIGLAIGIPILTRSTSPHVATQPVVAVPPVGHAPGGVTDIFVWIGAIIAAAAFLGLPVAGMIRVVMLVATRRTASLNQVRASLAAVDAQLRLLGAPGLKSDGSITP